MDQAYFHILLDIYDISIKLDILLCFIDTSCNFNFSFYLYLKIIWGYGQRGLEGCKITYFRSNFKFMKRIVLQNPILTINFIFNKISHISSHI